MQNFYRGEKHQWIRSGNLTGINGFCDPQSLICLRKRLSHYEFPSISFLGSGNYHYVSFLLMERIRTDFDLVLFDHHSDMQKPALENILSCGNWVRWSAGMLRCLRQIFLVGTGKKSESRSAFMLKGKPVSVIPAQEISSQSSLTKGLFSRIRRPAYLSVDKDVFRKDTASTNWDQGLMNMREFEGIFCKIAALQKIMGMDVCGEFPPLYGEPFRFRYANAKNSRANRYLLRLWEKAQSGTNHS